MIPELPGSSREEADVTTPSQEGRPEEARSEVEHWINEAREQARLADHYLLQRDEARAALAAVVVSSPATPEGEVCHCGRLIGFTACSGPCEAITTVSSPATRLIQGALDQAWADGYNQAVVNGLRVSTPASPPPASPAETREGWEVWAEAYERLTAGPARVIDGHVWVPAADAVTTLLGPASPAAVPLPEETEKP